MSTTSSGSPLSDTGAKAVAACWLAYLIALPFQRMWVLPWLGAKLQPPELVFLVLAGAAAVQWLQSRRTWRFVLADAVPVAWVAANLLALAWSPEPRRRDGLIETIGAVYVAALYVAVRITATPQLLDRFGSWFAYSAAAAAAVGIGGSVASYAGLPNLLATSAMTPIPYIGDAPRAQAFTAGPQMLASVLIVAIPLFVASRMKTPWRLRDCALLGVLALGLAATISKTGLCLAAAAAVMWAAGPRRRSEQSVTSGARARVRLAAAAWVIVAGVFTLGSHVMALREVSVPSMTASQLISGERIASFDWRGEAWVVMPTTYVFNKQASLRAIARAWPAGVGPAGQPAFTAELRQAGRFPETIWLITPHSTYLGTIAELGAAGIVALLCIFAGGVRAIRCVLSRSHEMPWEGAAYAGIGAAFLIEAISTDLLNCRHYWFLLAVIAARCAQSSAGAGAALSRARTMNLSGALPT